MAFCVNCGKELVAGSAFCSECGAPVQSAVTQVPLSGIDVVMKEKPAQDYWIRRLLAFIVDAILVFVVVAIAAAVISIPSILLGYTPGTLPINWLASGGFSILFNAIFVLYFVFAEATNGSSLGKYVFRLRVTTRRGTHPTLGQAFIRNISKIYWALLFLDIVVGLATSKDYKEKLSDRYLGASVEAR